MPLISMDTPASLHVAIGRPVQALQSFQPVQYLVTPVLNFYECADKFFRVEFVTRS
jgi:hypothetical protein